MFSPQRTRRAGRRMLSPQRTRRARRRNNNRKSVISVSSVVKKEFFSSPCLCVAACPECSWAGAHPRVVNNSDMTQARDGVRLWKKESFFTTETRRAQRETRITENETRTKERKTRINSVVSVSSVVRRFFFLVSLW